MMETREHWSGLHYAWKEEDIFMRVRWVCCCCRDECVWFLPQSLDKMPLTDPENFGTPVLMQVSSSDCVCSYCLVVVRIDLPLMVKIAYFHLYTKQVDISLSPSLSLLPPSLPPPACPAVYEAFWEKEAKAQPILSRRWYIARISCQETHISCPSSCGKGELLAVCACGRVCVYVRECRCLLVICEWECTMPVSNLYIHNNLIIMFTIIMCYCVLLL